MEQAWIALAILVIVLGGLWLREYISTTMDARTYARWVEDREEILEQLEQTKKNT
jgi:hypothetical protein